jgi:hypothetical protein
VEISRIWGEWDVALGAVTARWRLSVVEQVRVPWKTGRFSSKATSHLNIFYSFKIDV